MTKEELNYVSELLDELSVEWYACEESDDTTPDDCVRLILPRKDLVERLEAMNTTRYTHGCIENYLGEAGYCDLCAKALTQYEHECITEADDFIANGATATAHMKADPGYR